MIAKIKRNISLGDTIGYNLKEESQLIDSHNLCGDSIEDYSLQMELTQKLFTGRAKNLTAHIILSPSIEDGKRLTLEMGKEIVYRHLVRMELDKNQALVFLHEDKEHVHLHIVVNRINREGKIYRTRENEMLICQRSGNIIAKELGMRQAGSKNSTINKPENVLNTEQGLMSQIRQDCNNAKMLAGPPNHPEFDVERYFDQLKRKGYKVRKYHHSKTKVIYGYGLAGLDNHFYKASSIGEEFLIKNLDSQLPEIDRKSLKEQIDRDLKKIIAALKDFNIELYFSEIQKRGYQIKRHFLKDSNGIETAVLRGYSIGKDSTFFTVSEISPDLTLKKLEQQGFLSSQKQQKEQGELERQKIIECLNNLTSGQRYQQVEDFIKALEINKMKVHLRYNSGKISGYSIRIGNRNYGDSEIGNGSYSINVLSAKGVFRHNSQFIYPERPFTISDIMKKGSEEINKKHIRQAIRNSKSKIPKQKYLYEKDLSAFSKSINEHFGFKIKLHFVKNKNGVDTQQVRGYSIGFENTYYSASTLGREFNLSNLSRATMAIKL